MCWRRESTTSSHQKRPDASRSRSPSLLTETLRLSHPRRPYSPTPLSPHRAALGLDAGSASTVAAELAAYLDAAAVPGGRGPPPRGGGEASGGAAAAAAAAASPSQAGGGGALHASGPVLTRDQYETAARLLLVEALCREAGRPGDALAWTDGGGLAPLTAERAAALRGEVVGAAAGAAAAPPAAAVTPAVVPPPAPQPAAGPAKIPPTPFAPLTPPSPPHQPAALAAAGPAGLGGGPTVALGAGALGAVARSASFLAATPERLADLWRSPSAAGGVGDEIGGGGGNGPPRPPLAKPAALPPAGLGLPAAAAAAAAAGVLAYAAFAERRALGRALRAAAARLGVVDAARAAVAVGVAR